jgi:hypothetical protein
MKKNVLLVLIALAAVACSDSDLSLNPAKNNSRAEEIAAAQTWYKANVAELVPLQVNDNLQIKVSPEWTQSYRRSNKLYKTVEVTLRAEQGYELLYSDNGDIPNVQQGKHYARSLTRFIVLTDRKTSEKQGFFMSIAPSARFWEQTKGAPYKNINYLNLAEQKFDGYIIYHNLDGSLRNGWKYTNGEITNRIAEKGYVSDSSDLRCAFDYMVTVCIPITIITTVWDEVGSTVTEVVVTEECYDVIVCPDNGGNGGNGDDGGDGGDGGDGDGGNGGDGDGYIDPQDADNLGGGSGGSGGSNLPTLANIFNTNSAIVSTVEPLFNSLRSGDYGAMITYIKNNPIQTINLATSSSISGNVSFGRNGATRYVYFYNQSSINTNTMKEAIFYAAGLAFNTTSGVDTYDPSLKNAFFEAKVFRDINYGIGHGDYVDVYTGSVGTSTQFANSYKSFIDGVISDGYFTQSKVAAYRNLLQDWPHPVSSYDYYMTPYLLLQFLGE